MLTRRRNVANTKFLAAGSKAAPAAMTMRRKVPARAVRSAAGENLSTEGRNRDLRRLSTVPRAPEVRRGEMRRLEDGGCYLGIPPNERFPVRREGDGQAPWT